MQLLAAVTSGCTCDASSPSDCVASLDQICKPACGQALFDAYTCMTSTFQGSDWTAAFDGPLALSLDLARFEADFPLCCAASDALITGLVNKIQGDCQCTDPTNKPSDCVLTTAFCGAPACNNDLETAAGCLNFPPFNGDTWAAAIASALLCSL